jgi:2-keto-4-pentenoate hydratase/2-oxohepta-3-ene-1,7-dioic acid hydratase in catechol pathway
VRLFRTTKGIARQRDSSVLELLGLPHRDIAELLRGGIDSARTAEVIGELPLEDATILAPVDRPSKVVIAGGNYIDHVEEAALQPPSAVPFVVANGVMLIGPHQAIMLPTEAPDFVDYEGEVALVIGVAGANIAASHAREHIAGLTVVNDVTARDVQLKGIADGVVADVTAVTKAKQFPTFKPIGPALVTFDEFADPLDLRITTSVNGALRQDGRTSQMVFNVAQIIEAVSATVRLEVGDVVLTGTPAGVALATGGYLKDGDTVEVSVEDVGVLTNAVVRAP